MVQSIRRHRAKNPGKPIRILELGPGTGPITESIVQGLRESDSLDVVEIDQRFYELIKRRYAGSSVNVFNMDVLEFETQMPYDVIISSIPYEQIPASVTDKIWRKKLAMIAPGGSIAYYKYYRFNHFSCEFERRINKQFCTRDKLIWRNVPPAIAYHLTIPGIPEGYYKNVSSPSLFSH
jgi:phospholipid N-methyltransferase